MRSKMNVSSHPLHPILIVFPIAFFIGTLLFDTLGWLYAKESFTATGYYLNLAGLIGGLLAAVPGVVDYFFTVPPKSSAKDRAVKHGIINTVVLLIFLFVLFYRSGENPSSIIICLTELVAIVLLCVAGWMGGTLVYRNQIGVDHRFAYAGKYKEEYISGESAFLEVGEENELKINQMKLLHVKDKRIVLARSEQGYVAFDDRCTHKGASMAGGAMICGTAQCPWHGSQFDVHTGEVKAGPAKDPIATYMVEEENGKLYLKMDD